MQLKEATTTKKKGGKKVKKCKRQQKSDQNIKRTDKRVQKNSKKMLCLKR